MGTLIILAVATAHSTLYSQTQHNERPGVKDGTKAGKPAENMCHVPNMDAEHAAEAADRASGSSIEFSMFLTTVTDLPLGLILGYEVISPSCI